MDNLKNLSTADLKAELERREQEAAEAALAARLRKNQAVFAHKDVLLSLMTHGRTSCSDENPSNGSLDPGNGRTAPRCYKCALLNLSEFELDEVELDVTVTVHAR